MLTTHRKTSKKQDSLNCVALAGNTGTTSAMVIDSTVGLLNKILQVSLISLGIAYLFLNF